MAFFIDNNGNITLVQGDSGEISLNGIPTDRNYIVYFAIQNENRETVGSEIFVNSNKSASVVIALPAALTDLLEVGRGEEYTEYYYGVKICFPSDGLEDTLLLGNSKIGDLNTITVYPKKVEGTTNDI